MSTRFRCIIMGAAGRDFHDFQVFFRRHPEFHVCAFTAAQIPFIETRVFPRSLAGAAYNADIPIFPEERLPELIDQYQVDFVFLAYSDLRHLEVMHKASLVEACGAGFGLLGPRQTQLDSNRPVISVTAVRTGAGKSPLTQHLARHLKDSGRRVAVLRHPMPYGELSPQRAERFSTNADMDHFDCTVEEREEFAPYLALDVPVFAGLDYEQILREAEPEADVLLWDGGNNDLPFFRPKLSFVVADALRAGHEVEYHPGETNFRMADVIVINKIGQATAHDVRTIREHAAALNPGAEIVESNLVIDVDRPELIAGRRVLVVEDGPTVTHGDMGYGAGMLAARKFGAAELIDPRQTAVGTIADAFRQYPHLVRVLPALGYSKRQQAELAESIEASKADVVVDASPAALQRLLKLDVPVVRVSYSFQQSGGIPVEELVGRILE